MSSFPEHRLPHSSTTAGNPGSASWRQIFKRALEQSMWRRNNNTQPKLSDAVKNLSFSRTHIIFLSLAAIVLLVIAIPVILIIRAESRPTHVYRQGKSVVVRGESLLGMSQRSAAKPKPSPYKYTLATPITRPSTPIVFTPRSQPQNATAPATPQIPNQAATVTPALPQTANNTVPPSPATPTSRIPFTPVVYTARHDKRFGGCSGQLTLNSGGLNFNCPENSDDSIQVGLNEIGAIDENGVQTTSGKKYHFTITGMSKPAAQQLFSNWLHQVR
ncbi:MAG: hypothetical protein JST28_05420 [Acidobacteria bacterium]|nr:hypothetical protein [Acidobacteriota bacterium]